MLSFKVAGYLIWQPGEKQSEVLMCWEDRKKHKSGPSKRLLGFPGGHRDRMDEQPIQVAARETDEETRRLLSLETTEQLRHTKDKPVIWIHSSKYALFLHELTASADQDIHLRLPALPRDVDPRGGPLPLLERGGDPEVVVLQWVPVSAIVEHHAHNFHPFVRVMIRALLTHKILPFMV